MAKQDSNTIEADLDESQLSSVRQFVSFLIREEIFAFSIDLVQEIIRVPALARVPMAPPSMLGLANLRGEVLPVFDLRAMLGVEHKDTSDASRVLVVDDGMKVGLVVDRVAEVLNVPVDRIENVDAVEKTIDSKLLSGVVKNFNDHDLVQLFDPGRLPELQVKEVVGGSTGRSSGKVGKATETTDTEEVQDDVLQIVSLLIGEEEYAFNLADVDEIVRVPTQIAEVPNAPFSVVGLCTLRDRVLPLVSLRDCLGQARTEQKDSNRVVVLQIKDGEGYRRVGMIVDRVREVLRVPRDLVDEVPEGVKRHGANEIECICKLDGGQRLVSVLSAGESISGVDLSEAEKAMSAMSTETTEQTVEDDDMNTSADAADLEDVQLVVFKLAKEDFGISIHAVQEIIRLPEQFVEVPKAQAEVAGIINLRSMVLPVIDMRRYFHLAPCERSERQRIIVLNSDGVMTGYIVDSVTEVLRVTRNELTDPPALNSEAARFVKHVAKAHGGKSMVLVLESSAFDVLNADSLQAGDANA